MGGAIKNVAKSAVDLSGARGIGAMKESVKSGGYIGSLAKDTGKAAGKANPFKNIARKKRDERRAREEKSKSALEEQFGKQEAATQKIESLFQNLKDPSATTGDYQQALSGIRDIDISKQTGAAEGDVGFLRNIAQSEGTTAAGQRLLAQQAAMQSGRMNQIQEDIASQRANQLSQMSQFGGAGSGARERLAAQGQSSAIREQQRERQAGEMARLGILSQDEMRKLQVAQSLPGQQLAVGQQELAAQQAQVGSQFQQAQALQGARQFDVAAQQAAQQYKTGGLSGAIQRGAEQQGRMFAAGQLADAIAGQRQKGALEDPGSAFDKMLSPSGTFSIFGS